MGRIRKAVVATTIATIAVVALPEQTSAAPIQRAIHVRLFPVGGSSITGQADLVQVRDGTRIEVFVLGAAPGRPLVSAYSGLASCGPRESSSVIGAPYAGSMLGIAQAAGFAGEALDEIGSVSILDAQDGSLLACASVLDAVPTPTRYGNWKKGHKKGRPFEEPTEPN